MTLAKYVWMLSVVNVVLLLLLSTVDGHNSINTADGYRLTSSVHKSEVTSRPKRSTDDLTSSLSSDVAELDSDHRWNQLSSVELYGEGKRGGGGGDRRVQQGFVGMRGKKDDNEMEDIKRSRPPRPADSFFGMRGKKQRGDQRAPRTDVFYGMRGRRGFQLDDMSKRQIPADRFFGMRGKKDDHDHQGEVEENLRLESMEIDNKRADVRNTFLGMRGKKSYWPSPYNGHVDGNGDAVYPRLVMPNEEAVARRQAALFFRQSQPNNPPAVVDHKRQVGNIFIGMRG